MKTAEPAAERPVPAGWRAIPKGIWALGFVSLFMDTSSELIHSLLPVFLVSVLGTSILSVGLIEGVAEATASITKVFSGTLSDYLGKRKMLTVIGYDLAALTKPMFPWPGWAATWPPDGSGIPLGRPAPYLMGAGITSVALAGLVALRSGGHSLRYEDEG
jgi:hypothetical protein